MFSCIYLSDTLTSELFGYSHWCAVEMLCEVRAKSASFRAVSCSARLELSNKLVCEVFFFRGPLSTFGGGVVKCSYGVHLLLQANKRPLPGINSSQHVYNKNKIEWRTKENANHNFPMPSGFDRADQLMSNLSERAKNFRISVAERVNPCRCSPTLTVRA